ncbi:hypothetical protein [Granulicella sp. S156]|uniref:hypothetical protein n=1 Tax=Granulicella sp. S156 TaxID=1747224 RepID=UPI00131C5010|nr:hypothetical protein [Granulicella sp. S156]
MPTLVLATCSWRVSLFADCSLLLSDIFHPHYLDTMFIGLLDRKVNHGASGGGSMPVNLSGIDPH